MATSPSLSVLYMEQRRQYERDYEEEYRREMLYRDYNRFFSEPVPPPKLFEGVFVTKPTNKKLLLCN